MPASDKNDIHLSQQLHALWRCSLCLVRDADIAEAQLAELISTHNLVIRAPLSDDMDSAIFQRQLIEMCDVIWQASRNRPHNQTTDLLHRCDALNIYERRTLFAFYFLQADVPTISDMLDIEPDIIKQCLASARSKLQIGN